LAVGSLQLEVIAVGSFRQTKWAPEGRKVAILKRQWGFWHPLDREFGFVRNCWRGKGLGRKSRIRDSQPQVM
jgi:hypothetical protein